jgi:methylmalonyl-CoA mutase cobalamin-binding subunit
MRTPTIITGTVGMDAHVIGTKILSRAFREAGFTVVELGFLRLPKSSFMLQLRRMQMQF